jgi:hypothetical protein
MSVAAPTVVAVARGFRAAFNLPAPTRVSFSDPLGAPNGRVIAIDPPHPQEAN